VHPETDTIIIPFVKPRHAAEVIRAAQMSLTRAAGAASPDGARQGAGILRFALE
jgi:hypothetical protein